MSRLERVDKPVVLQKPHEDAAQNPGHGHLGQVVVAPGIVALGRAFLCDRLAVHAPEVQVRPQALQIREQPVPVERL